MGRLECDRMFLAVIETGSFTGAADKLGTRSGQTSKLISHLETELGVRLLNRTTRSVAPTEAGRAYYDRLKPLVDELDTLDLDIRNISQSPRGRLRLTAPLTFGTLELAPALNAFAGLYPDIEIDVSFSDRVVNVVDEGFDLAVRVGRPGDSSLILRRLCAVRIVVVGAPAYLEERGAPEAPSDLARHSCIIDTNFREPNRWPFKGETGEVEMASVDGRIRYSNAEACVQAAELGLGLACVPAFVAGEALRSGRLIRLLASFEPDPYDVHVLYPHSRHLAAKVRLLVDFLSDRYRQTPHWEKGW
ncbi:LysR family transcriptional regulator [Pontibaca methylaminivorans]|uniref:Transcriptional regulator, LysR family n=1 Tax=Pontibaca methylaminivorans TaxID=515897 RepID=A0A1R3WBN4_9RHOB|nr:LysR family transcriptional regulator [Pontibaca methylaminivorans]SIT73724.1 transcriptional regulator, LysR family [Pontibaca methylaminivorans]